MSVDTKVVSVDEKMVNNILKLKALYIYKGYKGYIYI